MIDYPTRAEIDAARGTLTRLRSRVGGPSTIYTLAWSALSNAVAILDHLDDVPGLHLPAPDPQPEPEPEPKPTAAQVLLRAFDRAKYDSVEESILWAAKQYAEDHPEWFADWHEHDSPRHALHSTGVNAHQHGDFVASKVLWGASSLAVKHPELFGGAS